MEVLEVCPHTINGIDIEVFVWICKDYIVFVEKPCKSENMIQ